MSTVRTDTGRLVDGDRVRFGRFAGPIGDVNLDAAQPWSGWRAPRAVRRLRLKEWQAFQIVHPRFFIVIALFDAKWVSLAQMKLYDRVTGQKYALEKQLPPWAFRVPNTLRDSLCEWERGNECIRFGNHLQDGYIDVSFRIAQTKDTPAVSGQLRADAQAVTPMVVSIPFAKNRGMYSHKAPMPVEGRVQIDAEAIEIEPGTAALITDDHKGYYGRVMRWDWVVGARYHQGVLQAFNLTHNASIDPERFNENGFWLDGVLHPLPAVRFERDDRRDVPIWSVRDRAGHVDIRFHAQIPGRLFVNYGLLESRYLGPFGMFEGELSSPDGARLSVDEIFGMGERFWLKA